MCREINPRNFVINALYFYYLTKSGTPSEPLSLDPHAKGYFWRYTFIASQKLRAKLSDICLFNDRYSMENVIWNDNLYINVKNDKLSIDKDVDIYSINEFLASDIASNLPNIFQEARKELLQKRIHAKKEGV